MAFFRSVCAEEDISPTDGIWVPDFSGSGTGSYSDVTTNVFLHSGTVEIDANKTRKFVYGDAAGNGGYGAAIYRFKALASISDNKSLHIAGRYSAKKLSGTSATRNIQVVLVNSSFSTSNYLDRICTLSGGSTTTNSQFNKNIVLPVGSFYLGILFYTWCNGSWPLELEINDMSII